MVVSGEWHTVQRVLTDASLIPNLSAMRADRAFVRMSDARW
jgi:hypothetical protein